MAHKDEPLPLSRLQLAHELLDDYRDLLPELPLDEARRIGGEQEIIARYEPEQAVETLPALLARRKDRDRLLTLLERVLADKRVQRIQPTAGADRDARAHPPRAWLGGPPAETSPVRRGSGAKSQQAQDDPMTERYPRPSPRVLGEQSRRTRWRNCAAGNAVRDQDPRTRRP